MCSEIDRFPFILRRMSSGSDHHQFSPRGGGEGVQSTSDEREVESDEVEEEKHGGSREGGDRDGEVIGGIRNVREAGEATVCSRESEKRMSDDEEDGYKTPTSSDHKIPPIMECPPAPRKTRPQSSSFKRKSSPERSTPPRARRRIFEPDSSDEVESVPNEDSAEDRQPKKPDEGRS